ncbi:MAG: manganese/iron superoxide dismutase-like protein superoxide dismutase, Fe-Mn family [Candidatus Taylorbacteria bacterium]|nr:manganese/iron superoxide dismutase-like protein superoxide dismutase, Fe-Mn family [Candidatus Taylorbacteria bacterium]
MFQAKQFTIPEINGISAKTIEEHLKLYAGYVKHANLIQGKLNEYKSDVEKNAYVIGELNRRFAFEFDGMRNHEYYFEQLEGGQKDSMDSELTKKMIADFGSVDAWLTEFKTLCMTRGIGWAVLWYDKVTDKLINAWVDEQHLGQLNGLAFIYGVDMWEHSYLMDYTPADKKKYVESYLMATNQEVSAKRFDEAKK